jgi:hypothetical protein
VGPQAKGPESTGPWGGDLTEVTAKSARRGPTHSWVPQAFGTIALFAQRRKPP